MASGPNAIKLVVSVFPSAESVQVAVPAGVPKLVVHPFPMSTLLKAAHVAAGGCRVA